MGIAIRVSDVTKIYQRYSQRKQFRTLKSALLGGSLLAELRPDERFEALNDITFNVREGTTFAIIGRNGSGKSTLLKCIAGISKPSAGTVVVNGRISRILDHFPRGLLFLRPPAGDFRGRSVMGIAIRVSDVTKIYQRSSSSALVFTPRSRGARTSSSTASCSA